MGRYAVAVVVGVLLLAGCGSSTSDHAGSNVEPVDADEGDVQEEAPDTEPEAGPAEPEPDPVEEEDEDEGGWKVPTVAYGTAADVEADSEANGVWSVVTSEPVCGVTIELGEYSFLEDPDPQGQWCEVAIAATNDADQPLDFWMDTEVVAADWDGRSFTPDSDAMIEVNESLYSETQVGQTFEVVAMFDIPEGVELAGVAMQSAWSTGDAVLTVWAAD